MFLLEPNLIFRVDSKQNDVISAAKLTHLYNDAIDDAADVLLHHQALGRAKEAAELAAFTLGRRHQIIVH